MPSLSSHKDPWVGIVDPADDETTKVSKMNWRTFRTLVLRHFSHKKNRECNNNKNNDIEFTDLLCHLLSFCTTLSSEHSIYGLWISLNDSQFKPKKQTQTHNTNCNEKRSDNSTTTTTNIKLIISLSHYMSNTTLESTMQNYDNNNNKKCYFLLQIFEENAFSLGPLLTFRMDFRGEIGELVWLQKGNSLSGNQMLSLFSEFADYLQIECIYLMDTAQIALTDKRKAYLRILHCISSVLNSTTWYEDKAQFKPIDIVDWPLTLIIPEKKKKHSRKKKLNRKSRKRMNNNNYLMERETAITQSVSDYKNALEYVRNMKLSDMMSFLNCDAISHLIRIQHYYKVTCPFDYDCLKCNNNNNNSDLFLYETVIDEYCSKYNGSCKYQYPKSHFYNKNRTLSNNHNDNNETRLKLETVHDLCRRIECNAFFGETLWKKKLAKRHLRWIYDTMIDPTMSLPKQTKFHCHQNGVIYLDCIRQIANMRVFCRGIHHQNPHKKQNNKVKSFRIHVYNAWKSHFNQRLVFFQKQRTNGNT